MLQRQAEQTAVLPSPRWSNRAPSVVAQVRILCHAISDVDCPIANQSPARGCHGRACRWDMRKSGTKWQVFATFCATSLARSWRLVRRLENRVSSNFESAWALAPQSLQPAESCLPGRRHRRVWVCSSHLPESRWVRSGRFHEPQVLACRSHQPRRSHQTTDNGLLTTDNGPFVGSFGTFARASVGSFGEFSEETGEFFEGRVYIRREGFRSKGGHRMRVFPSRKTPPFDAAGDMTNRFGQRPPLRRRVVRICRFSRLWRYERLVGDKRNNPAPSSGSDCVRK
jgi:hypothetical protein